MGHADHRQTDPTSILGNASGVGTRRRPALEVLAQRRGSRRLGTPADVKETYGDASILRNSRVVFNIGGNKFRLVVRINYPYRIVYIRFVGTHEEYDRIDAETI